MAKETLKEYKYTSWKEKDSHDNCIGDCTRLIEAITANKRTHHLVITYNQRFWSHSTYQYNNLKDASTRFYIEKQKIIERKEKLKTNKWRS